MSAAREETLPDCPAAPLDDRRGTDGSPRLPAVSVLAAGPGWLAVDKPAGLSVHNAPGADLVAMLRDLLAADGALRFRIGWAPPRGLHPVNRLDRETSGVLVLACEPGALRLLAGQFIAREVGKRYVALLQGRLSAPVNEWGLWDWSLNAKSAGGGQPRGSAPRVACRTRWWILGRSAHRTMVACEPLTGRTHQIRRHARLSGHPVVGDRRYGPRDVSTGRLALHALALRFTPPGARAPVTISTPEIPPTLLQLFWTDRPVFPERSAETDFIPLAMERMPS